MSLDSEKSGSSRGVALGIHLSLVSLATQNPENQEGLIQSDSIYIAYKDFYNHQTKANMEANENSHLLLSLGWSEALSRFNIVITATTSIGRSEQIRILHRAKLHSNITARNLSIVNGVPIVSIVTTKTIRRISIEILVRRKITNTITLMIFLILLHETT